MYLKTFKLGLGARLPSLQTTLKRNSVAQSMSGNTVYMSVRETGTTATLFTKSIDENNSSEGTITNATGGVARFDWVTTDFTSTGYYEAQFFYANAAGKYEYCDDIQPIEIYPVFST